MSDSPKIKPAARRLVDSLPDSATWDDLAYEVYVRVQCGQARSVKPNDADSATRSADDARLRRTRLSIRSQVSSGVRSQHARAHP